MHFNSCFIFTFQVQASLGRKPEGEFSIGWAAVSFVSSVNHAMNFILYVISGQHFRRQATAVLFCRKEEKASLVRSNSSHITL